MPSHPIHHQLSHRECFYILVILVYYLWLYMIGTGGGFHLCFKFSPPLLASEVVFVKMPSRQRKRKAKRREEYLLNQDDELPSSVRC